MALKAAFNWDHLLNVNLIPAPVSGNSSAPYSLSQWLETSPTSNPTYAWVSSSSNPVQIDSAGWLTFGQTSVQSMGALVIPLSMAIDTTKPASWVGFRFKMGGTQQINSSSVNIAWTSGSSNGTGPLTFLNSAQLASWGCVIGKEYYFELQFVKGASAYTVNVWMDGVLKSSNITSVTNNSVASSYLWIGAASTATATTLAQWSYRDIYFLDEDGLGNFDSTRLGPIRTTAAPISAVTAPNYTVSDPNNTGLTDPKAILSRPMDNPPVPTPNLTNAATLDPLTISFNASGIVAGSKILAVKYQNAILNQQSGNGVMNAAAVQGQNSTPLTQETFTDATMRYSRVLGILKTAPDGTAWTPAKIAATQLVLTPTSV